MTLPSRRVFADPPEMARAAAERVADLLRRRGTDRKPLSLVLAGGRSADLFNRFFFNPRRFPSVPWGKIHLFWGDERCVPVSNPGNSYAQARDVLLAHVPVPVENIHRVESELEPATAAQAYAATLRGFGSPWPRFDLILLGMGDDGHTASLFPGSPVDEAEPVIAVTAHYQNRPANRVSLTPRVINDARQVVFLVSGQSKSETLASVLNGDYHPDVLPAQRIRPRDGTLTWLVDEAAGSKL